MSKTDYLQMEIPFDEVPELAATGVDSSKTYEYMTFPSASYRGKNIVEKLQKALSMIERAMSKRKPTLASFIFESVFIKGLTRNEMVALGPQTNGVRIPSIERLRQLTLQIVKELLSGNRSRQLQGVRLRADLLEDIRRVRETVVGTHSAANAELPDLDKAYPGVAMLLGMNALGENAVYSMIDRPYYVSSKIPKDVFGAHFLAVYYTVQGLVRPASRETIKQLYVDYNAMKRHTPDDRLVDVILLNSQLFQRVGDDYMLCFDKLTNYQKMARIIYECKSISYQGLVAEWARRTDQPSSMVLTETRRRYPWCVPMGKSRWIYSADERPMERVQDVVKRFCHERVRFTFDELMAYLESLGYEMKTPSVRSYAMLHCRRRNSDANAFCLTSAVTPEEDHLWYSKAVSTTRAHKAKAYYKTVERKVVRVVKASEEKRVLARELRRTCEDIFKAEKVSINNFYKILKKSTRVELVDVDGRKYIVLK